MNSVEFLDAVRTKHGLDSDRKLARLLKIDRTRLPAYRAGRRKLDPDACVAVAKALELPEAYVFASIAAERAKRTEHRRIWEKLARYAKHAGPLLLLAYASTAPAPAHATTAVSERGICIFRQIRRGGGGRGRDRRRGSDRRRTVERRAA